MKIGILGAGAFGTALAVALGRAGKPVAIWTRSAERADAMASARGADAGGHPVSLPESVSVSARIGEALEADIVLVAVPMQAIAGLLASVPPAAAQGRAFVSCAKGIDTSSGLGGSALIERALPGVVTGVLSGPGFAADIARGLPTAMTLACASSARGPELQAALSTSDLRLYLSGDVAGVEIAGALKNVVAIASGVVIGAGLGESARAALIARGFVEITRVALAMGGRAETMTGLAGLGDLVLTATSAQSRNFRHGLALGRGEPPAAGVTVEGVPTARVMARIAADSGIDAPVTAMVAALIDGRIALGEAVRALMDRPLKRE